MVFETPEKDRELRTEPDTDFRLPIAEMYPELTSEQQTEAEYFLIKYFEVLNAIFEEENGLTSSDLNATV